MIGEDLDRAADQAQARYTLLLDAFRGLFAAATANYVAPTQATLTELRNAAYAEAEAWLDAERQVVMDAVDEFGEIGARAVEREVGVSADPLSEDILDHLESLAEALDFQLRLQIERDVALLGDALLGMSLAARLGRGRGAAKIDPRRGAARDVAMSRLTFEFIDRSNRRWPSARHVRTLWRLAMVTAHTEAAILRADEIGLDELVVSHPDRAHGYSGSVLPLSDADFDETWDAMKTEIFHPNSHAFLVPVVEDE